MSNLKYKRRVALCTVSVFGHFTNILCTLGSQFIFALLLACVITHFPLVTFSYSLIRLTMPIEVQQGTIHAHSNP